MTVCNARSNLLIRHGNCCHRVITGAGCRSLVAKLLIRVSAPYVKILVLRKICRSGVAARYSSRVCIARRNRNNVGKRRSDLIVIVRRGRVRRENLLPLVGAGCRAVTYLTVCVKTGRVSAVVIKKHDCMRRTHIRADNTLQILIGYRRGCSGHIRSVVPVHCLNGEEL